MQQPWGLENGKIYNVLFLAYFMGDEGIFREIGMTKNEGKVYSELVRHGKLSASNIASKSEVPYGKIYVVLQSLIDKGLVQTVPEKTKKFVASDPKNIVKLIEEKEKNLEKMKKKVKEMKQFYENKEKDFLIIGEGKKGFWKVAEEMTKGEKFGYVVRFNTDIKQMKLSSLRKDLKKGLDLKELVRFNKNTEKNVKKLLKFNPYVRKFENKGIALAINEKEVFIGLINKNTTLLIRDKFLADVLSRMYLATYEKAPEIK